MSLLDKFKIGQKKSDEKNTADSNGSVPNESHDLYDDLIGESVVESLQVNNDDTSGRDHPVGVVEKTAADKNEYGLHDMSAETSNETQEVTLEQEQEQEQVQENHEFVSGSSETHSPTLAQRIKGIFSSKKSDDDIIAQAQREQATKVSDLSDDDLLKITETIGKKPTHLLLVGALPPKIQYGIGFALMIAALAAAGGLATTGFLKAGQFQERVSSGTQLKMLSQRVLSTAQFAVSGSSDSLSNLIQAQADIEKEFDRLTKGVKGLPAMSLAENEDLKLSNGIFKKDISAIVDGLLTIGTTIGDVPTLSAKLEVSSSKMSADLERLLSYLVSSAAPQTQIIAVTQLIDSNERIRRNGQGLIAGSGNNNQISDKELDRKVRNGFENYKSALVGKFQLSNGSGLSLDGKQLKDNTVQVDEFKDKFNGAATVFQWDGEDFTRITTSIRKEDGSRAVGTTLGKNHIGYSFLKNGGEFVGRALILGRPYVTKYEAIKDAGGNVIGALFVGFEVTSTRSAAEIVGDYNQSYNTFTSTLGSLVNGDSSLGMQKLQSQTGESILKEVSDEANNLTEVNAFIQKNVKQLMDSREGLQSMQISSESALLAMGRFVDTMGAKATSSFTLVYYSSGFIILALFALVLIGLINNRLNRIESWATSYKNLTNEADIIKFMGDIMPLEMGDLTSSFTSNTAAMEGITGGIRSSVNEAVISLRDAMSTVKSTTGSVINNVSESVESSKDLQDSNNRQSKEIEGVVVSVVKLAAAIQEVTDNTVKAEKITSSAKTASDAGARVVSETNEKMAEIRNSMQDVLKSVKHLGETSHEIGTIVEAIETITDRTQVIAVNASLEAAKAGAAGQGFQVLAGEVNRLAEQSNEALRTITALVQRIQGETAATIRVVEDSTNSVVEGAKLSETANVELSKISILSVQLQEVMSQIRAQSENQSSNAGEVRQSMDRLNVLSGEFQTTVSQMVAGVQQIDASMGSLQSTVSIFTTDRVQQDTVAQEG